MSELSTRQQAILNFIIQSVGEDGRPPTIREIGDAVDISSTSVVNYNLNKLENLNLVSRQGKVSRGIQINWQALRDYGFADSGGRGALASLVEDERATDVLRSSNMVRVPFYGVIAAGKPIDLPEPRAATEVDEWIEFAEGMVDQGRLRDVDQLFALRVQGNSMIDAAVLDGDIVILRHQERAENGEMVAAWIEGDDTTTLKHWYLRGSEVHLLPANPTFDPIVRNANQVHIQGKVVTVIRHVQ